MKNFYAIVLLSFLLGCSSTSDTSIFNTEVKRVQTGSKSVLFNKSLDWAAKHYNDSKSVIEVKDPQRGRIIGRGIVQISSNLGMRIDYYSYTIQIDVKEDKARIKLSNLAPHSGLNGVSDPSYLKKKIKRKLDLVIESYFNTIKLSTEADDW
ncbi:DUF4468 domain-containing protein [Pseudoalteromonas sp. MMG010]|uniref:DUF4468 domain-containing protein n=1 Tax=Pseudoalteromonas sp. MMG010 TaxID=2822685 RepID=UPI001B39DEEE|nr:DUF4468 domain-containing protein [Pseudoalteromonas sp. MMG010]MBQ4833689.1 DUF4468 domain-containing protein [Pseudoalteromonas sp. MMG010]